MSDLTDYQRGYLDGMWAYGWWKDGECFVGTTGMTYKRAVEKFLGDSSTVVYDGAERSPSAERTEPHPHHADAGRTT